MKKKVKKEEPVDGPVTMKAMEDFISGTAAERLESEDLAYPVRWNKGEVRTLPKPIIDIYLMFGAKLEKV